MDSPNKDKFLEGIDKERYCMAKQEFFEEFLCKYIPKGNKLLYSTWTNKFKANGDVFCQLLILEYQQIDGIHYNLNNTSSLVVCDITICLMLILVVITNCLVYIIDFKGAFLNGELNKGQKFFIEVQQGYEKFHPTYFLRFN